MVIGLGFALVSNAFAYFFSDKIALYSSGAKPVTREQLPRLYDVMERLAAKASIPVPKLYVVPEEAPNAFATGRNPNHASVAVTQGLLQLMNDDELEGVIAHELSHVRNYDILISSVAATLSASSNRSSALEPFPRGSAPTRRLRIASQRCASWLGRRSTERKSELRTVNHVKSASRQNRKSRGKLNK